MFPKGSSVLFLIVQVGGMGLGPSAQQCHPCLCQTPGWEAVNSGLAPAAESLFCLLSLKTETCFSFYTLLKKKISKKATVLAELVVSKGILQRSS